MIDEIAELENAFLSFSSPAFPIPVLNCQHFLRTPAGNLRRSGQKQHSVTKEEFESTENSVLIQEGQKKLELFQSKNAIVAAIMPLCYNKWTFARCFADSFIVTGDVLGHVKFFDQELKLLNWYFNMLDYINSFITSAVKCIRFTQNCNEGHVILWCSWLILVRVSTWARLELITMFVTWLIIIIIIIMSL